MAEVTFGGFGPHNGYGAGVGADVVLDGRGPALNVPVPGVDVGDVLPPHANTGAEVTLFPHTFGKTLGQGAQLVTAIVPPSDPFSAEATFYFSKGTINLDGVSFFGNPPAVEGPTYPVQGPTWPPQG